MTLKEEVEQLEQRRLREALNQYPDDILAVARMLGLSDQGVRNKMQRYGMRKALTSRTCPVCGRIRNRYELTESEKKKRAMIQ